MRAHASFLRWGLFFASALMLAGPAAAQGFTRRISTSSSNHEGNAASSLVAMSPDGRFFAYVSSATNLVDGDTNGVDDIFVYDGLLGETTRVSVDSFGNQGNARSGNDKTAISADGHYVVFPSWSDNLVPNDTNGHNDLFLRDRWAGLTTRISVDAFGNQVFGNSDDCVMSADGRFVACDSDAPELWSPDTNFEEDVILFDLSTGTPICVSVNPAGAASNGESLKPAISADGRWIAFTSSGSDIVPGDNNGSWDTFLRDMATGQTWRVSVDSFGNEANGPSNIFGLSVSADGRFVAFSSTATNLVPGDNNAWQDVFVHDHVTGETRRVSLDASGGEANQASGGGRLNADGSLLSFGSYASNLVLNDTNGTVDIFLKNLLTGTVQRMSVGDVGQQANGASNNSQISDDGRYVVFQSVADNLVFGDTNNSSDIFVRDLGICGSISMYCIGMINSTGNSAHIGWQGSNSVSQNDLVLQVSGCPPAKRGLFFFGRFETSIPFGEGYLCITGSQHRLKPAVTIDPSGAGSYQVDFTDPLSAASLIAPGDLWKFQFWYRDPQTVGHGFNLSDALSVSFCP